MEKKIGCVIAYHDGQNNYGTSLQGLATVKKIESLGYDCELIRYKKQRSLLEKIKLVAILLYSGDYSDHLRAIRKRISRVVYKSYAQNLAVRTQAVDAFKKKYLTPYFKEYNGYAALCQGAKNYAEVMVGSDQVWSLLSLYGNYYNLMFVDSSIPTFSYASSFGVSSIPSFQINRTRDFLNKIDRIGVREVSGKKIVDSLSDKKATVVVDPTLLLTANEWNEIIGNRSICVEKPYIFCYFLGKNSENRQAVEKLAYETGLDIVAIRHMDEYIASDERFGNYAPFNVDPLDFVNYISKAEYVCTDSFHGTVFSILNNRKFMTFYRYGFNVKGSRNSRIDSLLGIFDLKNRIYSGDISKIFSEIDYTQVESKLVSFRKDSIVFLEECLNLSKNK